MVHFFLFLSIPLHCINMPQFVYPFPYKWTPSSWQFLTVMTKAAMYNRTSLYNFQCIYGFIFLRSRITESESRYMFNILRQYQFP